MGLDVAAGSGADAQPARTKLQTAAQARAIGFENIHERVLPVPMPMIMVPLSLRRPATLGYASRAPWRALNGKSYW